MVDKISGFICLTEFFKIKMREAGIPDSKLFVRPNFVDAPPLRRAEDGKRLRALHGALVSGKGLLDAAPRVRAVAASALKIIGTGPMEQDLRDYIREKGIRNIELLGFKSGAEKWDILRNSLCLVMP